MSKKFFLSLLSFSLFSAFALSMEEQIETNNQNSSTQRLDYINFKTNTPKIRDAKCNGRDKIVVIGEDCKFAEVWNLNTKHRMCTFLGHKKPILCATWHPTKDIIFTGSSDNTIKIWDACTGNQINCISFKRCKNLSKAITSIDCFEDQYSIILAGTNNEVSVLRVKVGDEEHDNRWTILDYLTPPEFKDIPISCVAFNSQKTLAFTATDSGIVRIFVRPGNFTKTKRKWSLQCTRDLGHQVKSITTNNNGNTFIRLKNDNNHFLTMNPDIANFQVHEIFNGVADYNKNTDSFLIIVGQCLLEYKHQMDKASGDKLIIMHDSTIEKARYNDSGDRILIIAEDNVLHLWTKIHDAWIHTHKINGFTKKKHIFDFIGNKIIVANLTNQFVSILEFPESEYEIIYNQLQATLQESSAELGYLPANTINNNDQSMPFDAYKDRSQVMMDLQYSNETTNKESESDTITNSDNSY